MEPWPPANAEPIPDWPRYFITPDGTVYSIHRREWSVVAVSRCYAGYPRVCLHRDGQRSQQRVHVLVARTFLGPRPEGAVVCHRDDDKDNPHISNLYYGTRSDNAYDSLRNRLLIPNEELADLIWELYALR